ncbi:MAG TPA: hypothetical protein VFR49_10805 [Solirubrobacteraceae bacterium]|nr:hypothetical protein [Solirubrobacteraceae bacterium]
MEGTEDRRRPHGDEWRWGLGPARSTPSIKVIVTPRDRGEPHGPFGFARELSTEEIEPLLWEGD